MYTNWKISRESLKGDFSLTDSQREELNKLGSKIDSIKIIYPKREDFEEEETFNKAQEEAQNKENDKQALEEDKKSLLEKYENDFLQIQEKVAEEYRKVASWCNESGKYTIQEIDGFYQVVEIPEPTAEELQKQVRDVRDSYLVQYVDPYVTNPLRWDDLSEDEQNELKEYRRYLLNYTEQDNWWESNPKTFTEWKA